MRLIENERGEKNKDNLLTLGKECSSDASMFFLVDGIPSPIHKALSSHGCLPQLQACLQSYNFSTAISSGIPGLLFMGAWWLKYCTFGEILDD